MYYLGRIKIYSLLVIVAICICEAFLNRAFTLFNDLEIALLSYTSLVLICLSVWCIFLLFVTFELGDLPLVGLFFLAMLAYPSSPAFAWREPEVFTLLAGAIVGRGARLLLQKGIGRSHTMTISRTCSEVDLKGTQLANFLYLFLGLLLFSSCWQFKISNYYHGARWMGLWDNPNIYGMLMSAGLVLAVGLVAADRKKMEDGGWRMAKTGCQKIVIGSSVSLRQTCVSGTRTADRDCGWIFFPCRSRSILRPIGRTVRPESWDNSMASSAWALPWPGRHCGPPPSCSRRG